MKTIAKFELVDHGIEHSQYFRGCGVCNTAFENVATGSGEDPAEAIDDCLEQIAISGFETEIPAPGMEARIMEQEGWDTLPETPNTCDDCTNDCNYCESRYYISIRWN